MGDRRLRRIGAFLALIGLVLSFVSLPASAHTVNDPAANNVYNGTWPPNSSAVWNLPATNPPITPSCGIDVGILVDRSGSIADAGQQTNMRNSAKAIVTSLAGTPSRVGVWSFGTDSSATGTADYPAQQLTAVGGPTGPAGVTSLSATIDSIPIVTNVATNWEAGFNSVHVSSLAHTAPRLLFVLTDGKPTVHIDDLATGGTTNNDDVDGGIRTANLVKGDGTRVFGVGIGAAIDASTLGLVANPVAFNGSNFTTAGYTLTSFAELESTLRGLVTELCGGSVTVNKLADNGNGVFQPASGWDFTFDPTSAQLPNQTKTTDANGQANFNIDSFSTEQVTVTENLAAKPGYQLLADQLSCTNSNGPNPALTPVANGVRFDLGPTDIVSCTFKNKKQFVDLGIAKSDGGVSTVPGGNVTYTLTYGNKGNAAAPNTVITETVPANTTVDLGTGPADGKNDGWLCNGANSGVWSAGTTCTRAVGTVAAGASGLTVPFTVTVVNPAPFGLSLITNTATIGYDSSVGPDTNPADNTATDTTPVTVNPQLTITKKVVLAGQPCAAAVDSLTIVAGQSVTYCYVVTNPGNAPTINVKVRDDNATPANPADDFDVVLAGLTDQDGDGQADDLAAGATATGQSANKVFNSGGTFTNTATATGGGKTVTDTATVTVIQPSLNIVKTAVKTGEACPGTDGATLTVVTGQGVTYCYVVTNPGNAPLLDVKVRDDNGTPANPADDFDVTLTGLTDQDGDGQADDLAAGATATGQSASKSFDSVGSVTNIATATGKSGSGATFSKTDDAVVAVTQPAVNLVKTVVKTGQPCPGIDGVPLTVVAGQSVTYCYVVTNPGNAPLLNAKVRDDNATPANPADDFDVTLTGLTDQDGDGQADDLAAGATATGQSAAKVIDGSGTVTNIATASGVSASGRSYSTTDDAVVNITKPGLQIVKTAVKAPAGCPGIDGVTLVVNEGEQVRYCYVVTNPGSAPLLNVKVRDDNATPLNPADDFDVTLGGLTDQDGDGQADDLAAGATATGASALKSFEPGVVLNVATATGQSSTGQSLSATDTAVVEARDVPPTVVVTKSADPSTVTEPGGPVTFPVTVKNTSAEKVTVTSITDSVEGGAPFSVTAPATAPVTATTCATGVEIAPGATYSCSFSVQVSGNAGDVVDDEVVATVVDNDRTSATGKDDAQVTITDVPPTIVVTKSADPVSVPEPGGAVSFPVTVRNISFEPVTITSMVDSVDGGAAFSIAQPATAPVTATTCAVGTVVAPGATYSCSFSLPVSGNAGDVVKDVVTANVVDDDKTPATGSDDAEVTVTDVPPTIEVTKDDGGVSVEAPGGPVEYTVGIKNTSFEKVTVTSITDSVDGGTPFSVTAPATDPVTATTCAVGTVIDPGATYTCTFTLVVSGKGGEVVTDQVVASVVDDDETPATGTDDESTPVTPVVDLAITKSIDQSLLVVGQQGTYTLTITNKGPSDATDVVMTDTLPTGLTPVAVDGPSGWACTVAAPKITCTTAAFAAGATATVTVVVQVGADAGATVTNVAEVASKEPDKNPSDNRAEVTTPVVAVQPVQVSQPPSVAVQGATLPYTGSDSLRLVGVGMVLIGGGLLLLVAVRRRRLGLEA